MTTTMEPFHWLFTNCSLVLALNQILQADPLSSFITFDARWYQIKKAAKDGNSICCDKMESAQMRSSSGQSSTAAAYHPTLRWRWAPRLYNEKMKIQFSSCQACHAYVTVCFVFKKYVLMSYSTWVQRMCFVWGFVRHCNCLSCSRGTCHLPQCPSSDAVCHFDEQQTHTWIRLHNSMLSRLK